MRDLRNAVAQLLRTLQNFQTAQTVSENRISLSPVRNTDQQTRKLSPMSRSFKKTLHVSYISLLKFLLIYSCN